MAVSMYEHRYDITVVFFDHLSDFRLVKIDRNVGWLKSDMSQKAL